MSGRVVHFELPFDDGERAREFYRQVFGWRLEEMPGMDYTLAMSGPVAAGGMPSEPGYINGGLFARGRELRGPVLVIDVASIDDALAQVSAAGGATVLAKQAVGDMGFTAYVRDPEGNVVGLWETASP